MEDEGGGMNKRPSATIELIHPFAFILHSSTLCRVKPYS